MTEFCENVARKLKETVTESRGLDSEMRGLLRDLRSLLLYTELELKETHERKWVISSLKVAVQLAKDYVFSGVLEGGEQDDRHLFRKITHIINDGDVGQIYEALNYLKFAAQNYLDHTVRPSQGSNFSNTFILINHPQSCTSLQYDICDFNTISFA